MDNTKFVIKETFGNLYFSRIQKKIAYAYPDDCIVHYSTIENAITYETREAAQARATQLEERYPVNMYFEGPMKYTVEAYEK